jgi:hypothetical protein
VRMNGITHRREITPEEPARMTRPVGVPSHRLNVACVEELVRVLCPENELCRELTPVINSRWCCVGGKAHG